MPNNFRINKPLEYKKLHGLMESRRAIPEDAKDEIATLMNAIASDIVMEAEFLLAVRFSEPPVEKDGDYELSDTADISFILLENSEFGKIFPVFTCAEQLEKWNDKGDFYTIIANFDNIAPMIINSPEVKGLMINPFDDNMFIKSAAVSKWFEKKQIILNGHASHVITENTPLELYAPDPYPMALSNKLCECAKTIPEVKTLWLRGITLNSNPGYLLVIEADGAPDRFYETFGNISRPHLGDYSLHIVPFDEGFGKNAAENVEPIYKRQ